MRPLLLSSLALLFVACTETQQRPPPTDRFLFPSGIQYRSATGSSRGILYVASADSDQCFDQGTLMAVDLDRVTMADGTALPLLGSAASVSLDDLAQHPYDQLNVPEASRVFIQRFAGQMTFWNRPDAAPRLFLTTRAEGDYVYYVDVPEPGRLVCVGSPDNDCAQGAVSLTQLPGQQNDLPRAPAPFGLAVDSSGDLWVGHIDPADSPLRSNTNFASYLVHLSGATPGVTPDDFTSLNISGLPAGTSNSVIVDSRYVLVSGRFDVRLTASTSARRFLVRLLDKSNTGRLLDPGLDLSFTANEARGIALSKTVSTDASQRLYVAVRAPDSLLIVKAQDLTTDTPLLTTVGSVPLPNGPNEVKLLPRTGRSDLVLVTCSTAGVLAIYDPDVGQVVAQVTLGLIQGTHSPQPFGIDVQHESSSNMARVFVSNFGDGRISVVDIPDLTSPQTAQLVAYIGARQDEGAAATCLEEQQ